MKNFGLILCLVFSFQVLHAQAPAKFRYQAVARDAGGTVITGNIDIRFSLLENDANGILRYSETHHAVTNTQGVFELSVGDGSIVSGNMDNIDWRNHQYWLKVEMKGPGASDFVAMGSSQLLSVPYAMYAAESGEHLIAGPGIQMDNGVISNTGDLYDDNELQSLSINGNQLSISDGNSVELPFNGGTEWSVNGNTVFNAPVTNNVAIGTNTNGGAKLTIAGNGNDQGLIVTNTSGATAMSVSSLTTGTGIAASSTGGRAGQFVSATGIAGYFNSGLGYALVTDAGNVGIGTLTPARKLHVSGTTLISDPNNGVALEIGAGKVGVGITAPTNKFQVNGSSFMENLNGPALVIGQGNVGIGVNNPLSRLAIDGGNSKGLYVTSNSEEPIFARSYSDKAAGFFFSDAGYGASISSAGNYCIVSQQGAVGNSGATQGLLLKQAGDNWKLYIDSQHDYNMAYNNNLRAWIYDTDGSYHNASDRSIKRDIREVHHVLPGLTRLQAYTYRMKSAPDDSPLSLGFMAQEVEEQFPELVTEKEGIKTLCYDHFAVLAVQGIKEQQEKIDQQDEEIQALRDEVAQLKQLLMSSIEKK